MCLINQEGILAREMSWRWPGREKNHTQNQKEIIGEEILQYIWQKCFLSLMCKECL